LDTGASRHLTPDGNILFHRRPLPEPITITFGNGATGTATEAGDVLLHTPEATFLLTEVLHVPEATEQLISVRHATKRGLAFKFCADHCEIWQGQRALAIAPCQGDAIYYLAGWSPTHGKRGQPHSAVGSTTAAALAALA
jgi:hypothetical protein